VKPTVGAVDLVTRTTEGIKNTGNEVIEKKRTRAPRHFGPDQLLTIYDSSKAEGQYVLKITENGLFRAQFYVWHSFVDKHDSHCLVMSNSHLILFKKSTIASTLKMHESNLWGYDWKIKLVELSGDITTNPGNKEVILRRAVPADPNSPNLPKTSKLGKNNSELVVPCRDNEEVTKVSAELYTQIKAAPTDENTPSALGAVFAMAPKKLKSKISTKLLSMSASKDFGSVSGGLGEAGPAVPLTTKEEKKSRRLSRVQSDSAAASESPEKSSEKADGHHEESSSGSSVTGALKGVGKSLFNVVTLKPLRSKDKDKSHDKEKEKEKKKSPRKAESVANLAPHHSVEATTTADNSLAVSGSEKKARRKSLTASAEVAHPHHHHHHTTTPTLSQVDEGVASTATPNTAPAGPTIAVPLESTTAVPDGKIMKRRKSTATSPHPEAQTAPTIAAATTTATATLFEGDVEIRTGGTLGLGKHHKTRHIVVGGGFVRLFDVKDKTKLKKEFNIAGVTANLDPTHLSRVDLATPKKTLHLSFASEQQRGLFVDACQSAK